MIYRNLVQALGLSALLAAAGPLSAAVDRWTPLGPEGGTVTSLAVASGVPGLDYASTRAAGVFKSRDGGASWQPALQGLPASEPLLFLAAGGRDGRFLYAATESSLYATADGGGLWTRRPLPLPQSSFSLLALGASPAAPQTVVLSWAGASSDLGGMLESTDGGKTWKPIETGLGAGGGAPSLVAIAFAPSAPETVYAASKGPIPAIVASTDGGIHWSPPVVLALGNGPLKLAVDPRSARTVYLSWGGTVTRSTDGGATWTSLFDAGSAPDGFILTADLAVDPVSPGTIYFAFNRLVPGYTGWYDGGLFKFEGRIVRSTDGGASWSPPVVTDMVAALKVDGVSTYRVYAGVGRLGVLRSEDRGAHWRKSNRGLTAAPVCSVTPDPFTPDLLYISAGVCGAPFDPLESNSDLGFLKGTAGSVPGWTSLNQGARNPVRVLEAYGIVPDPRTSGTLYAATGQGLFKSTNGGGRWISLQSGLGSILDAVFRVVVDPSDPKTVYALGYKLDHPICGGFCPLLQVYDAAKSADGGVTWKKLLPGQTLGFDFGVDDTAFDFVIDPTDSRILYLLPGGPLLASTDHGATWKQLEVRIPGQGGDGTVSRLVIDPTAPQTLYALAQLSGHIPVLVKSTDGGHSWAPANQGLPPAAQLRDLALDTARPTTLYVATSQGVFLSDDGGGHWSPLANGLTKRNVWKISIDPFDPATIYAGTEGDGGLFVLTRSDR